jgi:hypothetical protein
MLPVDQFARQPVRPGVGLANIVERHDIRRLSTDDNIDEGEIR